MRRSVSIFAALCLLAASAAFAADGAAVYKVNCATCHGDNLDGNGPAGQYLNPKPRNLIKDPFKNKLGASKAGMADVVKNGLPGTAMAGFGHIAAADQEALVEYLCSKREGGCKEAGGAKKADKKKK